MPYENRDKLAHLIYQIENRKIPQPYHQIIQPEDVLIDKIIQPEVVLIDKIIQPEDVLIDN